MMNTRKILRETINQFILNEQIDFENTNGEFYAVDIHEPNEEEDVCDREYFDDEAFHKFFLYNDLSNDNVSIDVDEMDDTAFHMIEGSDKDTNVGKYYNKVMLCLRELAFYFHGQ